MSCLPKQGQHYVRTRFRTVWLTIIVAAFVLFVAADWSYRADKLYVSFLVVVLCVCVCVMGPTGGSWNERTSTPSTPQPPTPQNLPKTQWYHYLILAYAGLVALEFPFLLAGLRVRARERLGLPVSRSEEWTRRLFVLSYGLPLASKTNRL